jgi:hypothetical protein
MDESTQRGQLLQLSDMRNQALDIGFIARLLTLATMPHSNPGDADNYTCINGDYKLGRGRDAGCPAPPARIRTSGAAAYGSYCGCLASKRKWG